MGLLLMIRVIVIMRAMVPDMFVPMIVSTSIVRIRVLVLMGVVVLMDMPVFVPVLLAVVIMEMAMFMFVFEFMLMLVFVIAFHKVHFYQGKVLRLKEADEIGDGRIYLKEYYNEKGEIKNKSPGRGGNGGCAQCGAFSRPAEPSFQGGHPPGTGHRVRTDVIRTFTFAQKESCGPQGSCS